MNFFYPIYFLCFIVYFYAQNLQAHEQRVYWTQLPIKYRVSADWQLDFKYRKQWNEEGENFSKSSVLGITKKNLTELMDIRLAIYKSRRLRANNWLEETRPQADLIIGTNTERFAFRSISRLEYRRRENQASQWRYRQRFILRPQQRLWNDRVSPYLSEEIFINLEGDRQTKNHLKFGSDIALNDTVGLDLYYIWRATNKEPKRLNHYIFGFNMEFYFK